MGVELTKILNQFGNSLVKTSKRLLQTKKINSTNRLSKSIKHTEKDDEVSIWMNDYGILRDAGQLGKKRKILKGWNKSIFVPRGKGFTNKYPPVDKIRQWIQDKPVGYKPRTAKGLNSTAFLISRKIYLQGIQPGLFMSEAFIKEYKSLPDDAVNAYANDLENNLKEEN